MSRNQSPLSELRTRGLVEQVTNEVAVDRLLAAPGASIYIGFDPTADSLHVGHLLPALFLARLQRIGHKPIALVGGATGMIGDPSGKASERTLLTPELVAANVEAMRRQLSRFMSFEGWNAATMVDNGDWTRPISHLDWLRDVGKHFTVNYMLSKESVRRRLEDREHGISYTEFSYMLLQAHDFLHLFDHHACTMQVGGTDQWGNITAGIDLVRKVRGREVYGMTLPLLTTSSGDKFGKSEGNAIWLDRDRTTPYRFYQFWIRTDDSDVERHLRLFTFEEIDAIAEMCAAHRKTPERREAQKLLATKVTEIVHGKEGVKQAVRASEFLFGKELSGVTDNDLSDIFSDVPSLGIARSVLVAGLKLVDALVQVGACASRGEASRLIKSGGVYVNNRRAASDTLLTNADLASESMLLLRTGKKNYYLIRFI